jgi:sn-glycerol 3-phosphate transport system ATP-binding protein
MLDRKPGTLSGGQRQRVAIGRAMIRSPKVFLFDEPLSNLDAKLRAQMRIEIRRLHQRLRATSVFVTHDQVEAMTLADKLVVLNQGRIEQIGTPTEVYRRPASRFVAGFIGAPSMNFMAGSMAKDGRIAIGTGPLGSNTATAVTIGVRPDEIKLVEAPLKGTLDFDLELVEELGTGQVLYGRSGELEMTVMRNGSGEAGLPKPGQRLYLKIPMASVHLFDSESGRRIDLPPTRLAAE